MNLEIFPGGIRLDTQLDSLNQAIDVVEEFGFSYYNLAGIRNTDALAAYLLFYPPSLHSKVGSTQIANTYAKEQHLENHLSIDL